MISTISSLVRILEPGCSYVQILQVVYFPGSLQYIINYLLTESEVFTGKSWRLRFSHKDRMFEVNKLVIIWLFAWLLQARNRPMGITGE